MVQFDVSYFRGSFRHRPRGCPYFVEIDSDYDSPHSDCVCYGHCDCVADVVAVVVAVAAVANDDGDGGDGDDDGDERWNEVQSVEQDSIQLITAQ